MRTDFAETMRLAEEGRATNKKKALAFGVVAAMVALLFGLLLTAKPAHAKTFTVNYTGDATDDDPGNGLCDAGFGLCSLRAAIEEANAFAGPDVINFNIPDKPNIPGKEVKVLHPSKKLPGILEQVTINGYTQPGASPNTKATGNDAVLKIRLDGINVDLPLNQSGAGLTISTNASNSTVKGLTITRFRTGVALFSSFNKIEGNFIGTNTSGTAAQGNNLSGVFIDSSAPNNTIGGTTPEKRNVISGNSDHGIFIASGATSTKVQGNYIGTTKDGTGALSNGSGGVDSNSNNNTIGGGTSAAANTIAFNDGDGVSVNGGKQNSILSNSIFSNSDLGIDLDSDGKTPNDDGPPPDTDSGANYQQNFPELTSATTSGGTTTIDGELKSTPNKTHRIEFFSNPSGTDEGKEFLGSKNVTTSSDGLVTFTKNVKKVSRGKAITATATDPDGNTSEFSNEVAVG